MVGEAYHNCGMSDQRMAQEQKHKSRAIKTLHTVLYLTIGLQELLAELLLDFYALVKPN